MRFIGRDNSFFDAFYTEEDACIYELVDNVCEETLKETFETILTDYPIYVDENSAIDISEEIEPKKEYILCVYKNTDCAWMTEQFSKTIKGSQIKQYIEKELDNNEILAVYRAEDAHSTQEVISSYSMDYWKNYLSDYFE